MTEEDVLVSDVTVSLSNCELLLRHGVYAERGECVPRDDKIDAFLRVLQIRPETKRPWIFHPWPLGFIDFPELSSPESDGRWA